MFARQLPRLVQQSVRRYGHDSHFKPATMDELPVPRGSWQTKHDADQRRYNTALIGGLVFTIGTLIVAKTTGLVYLNYYPPKSIE